MQLGNALAPYDPLFFEEPIRSENVEAWGELKRGLQCTLATGESLYSRFEFLRLLHGDCNQPVGVLATIKGNVMKIRAQVFDPEGTAPDEATIEGSSEDAEQLAARLFDQIHGE